jgi:hypothetical protein
MGRAGGSTAVVHPTRFPAFSAHTFPARRGYSALDFPAPQRAGSGSRGHRDSFVIAGSIAIEAANRDNRSDSDRNGHRPSDRDNATHTRLRGCGSAARAAADSDRIETWNRDPKRRANRCDRHYSIGGHRAVNRDDVRG